MLKSTLDRFHDKYVWDPVTDCMIWTAANKPQTGHGRFYDGTRTAGAHRYSFTTFVRPLLPDEQVNHTCDRGACVNPDHIYGGTQQDNMNDKMSRGRFVHYWGKLTHCRRGHEFTDANTRTCNGKRECRECDNYRARRRYWAKKRV